MIFLDNSRNLMAFATTLEEDDNSNEEYYGD